MVPAENPSGAVYGAIFIGALLAAESGLHESYLDTLLSAVLATAVNLLAHSYAGALGQRLDGGERLTGRALLRAVRHDRSIMQGAVPPITVVVVAWITGSGQEAAVNWALWSVVASLIVFELIAGIRSRAAPRELTMDVGVGALMGVAILVLKIILH